MRGEGVRTPPLPGQTVAWTSLLPLFLVVTVFLTHPYDRFLYVYPFYSWSVEEEPFLVISVLGVYHEAHGEETLVILSTASSSLEAFARSGVIVEEIIAEEFQKYIT